MRCPDSKRKRNKLLIALHAINKHEVEDLAEVFSLLPFYVKRILKRHEDLMVPSAAETRAEILDLTVQHKIRNFILERLRSNKGLLSLPRLRQEIKDKLGLVIKPHRLRKLIKLDLRLVWKRARPQ